MISSLLAAATSTAGMLVLTIIALFVWYVKKKQQYWEEQGLLTPPGKFLFGDMIGALKMNEAFATRTQRIYNYFKSNKVKHGGIYIFTVPMYFPLDLEIIKRIMVTDFQHFTDRGVYINEEDDPLSAHLFALEGNKWKLLRKKLSPTFTSGKIKMMMDGVIECGRDLKQLMDLLQGTTLDIKEINARFTTDVIGRTAFGIDCNCLKNTSNDFREMGKKIFERTFWQNIRGIFSFAFPNLARKLHVKINEQETIDFFFGIVNNTIKYRQENNISRNDFMELLIQLKNKGKLLDDDSPSLAEFAEDNKITFEEVVSQAVIFFEAGFETSSTTMTWALYELSANPDVQEKTRKEILDVLAKHDGKVTYDGLQEMHYLERVILETLRKYPPLPSLHRVVTKEYKVPDTDLVLKTGTKINIPIMGIQRDPEVYPDPEKFDPDRFTEENKKNRPQVAWMPFGEGPRICIGMRFGLLETKIGLVTMLSNYKFKVNPKTQEPIQLDPKVFITSAQGGIWLDSEAI